jgi:hypothetical protein
MGWTEQVFRYCERGHEAGLLAEPLNALSNLAFLIVAWIVWRHVGSMRARLPSADRRFINSAAALVVAIGLGSVAFHVWATRWGQLVDVVPIAVFVVGYFAYALRRFLELNWPGVFLGVAALAACFALIASLCPLHDPAGAGYACLNGTIGYVPALLALVATGGALVSRGHSAGPRLLAAATVFVISLIARTTDLAACEMTRTMGHAMGLHFLWHALNAVVIYLLLKAALEAAEPPRRQEQSPAKG